MLHNVKSFLKNYLIWFQFALGVWQILKFTPPAALIKGLMGRLLSFLLPGFFPAYKQLRRCPGCLFKTVKCVMLKGMSQSKTTPLTSTISAETPLTNGTSKLPGEGIEVRYLGDNFKVVMDGNKVLVNGKMSYYISGTQWEKISNMKKECFQTEEGVKWLEKENEVVFVKGCKFIWQKIATGEVMEFGEVLDDLILENNDSMLISNDVWFLPVDLLEKSGGKLLKLLNLVGLIPRVSKLAFWVPTSLTIAAAVLEFSESLRSLIDEIINKNLSRSVHYICNKLPYPVRRFVYLLFLWVENVMPRNDIRLEVVRRDFLSVCIAGAAKTNSRREATPVDWLDEKEEYEFRCGCSFVIKATYDFKLGKCKATVQHTNAGFPPTEERVFVNCQSGEEFKKIGTLLSCLAASKAGSLFEYDCNDNKVHVRGWRESLRHYKEAGFPDIYKLTLHDVIV